MNLRVPISEAQGRLLDLVRRAEAGDEVILTEGAHAVRLVPVEEKPVRREASPEEQARRRAAMERIRASAGEALPGPDAAHSQDFLYDEFGLPK